MSNMDLGQAVHKLLLPETNQSNQVENFLQKTPWQKYGFVRVRPGGEEEEGEGGGGGEEEEEEEGGGGGLETAGGEGSG